MAAKPFSDRIVPGLSNVETSQGETSFMAEVSIDCAVTCSGQVNATLDGEVQLTVGFEKTGEGLASVIMNGVLLTGQGQNLDIEVDCQENVLVTGRMHIQGSDETEKRLQKDPVLVGRDPDRCQIPPCRQAAISGRTLCSRHAYPGEVVKSDRRRAIEATLAKRAKVSKESGR